jgi:hypothetical protein
MNGNGNGHHAAVAPYSALDATATVKQGLAKMLKGGVISMRPPSLPAPSHANAHDNLSGTSTTTLTNLHLQWT